MGSQPFRYLPGIVWIAYCLAVVTGFAPCYVEAQENLNILTWRMYTDAKNALYREISREAFRYLDERERAFNALSTQDEYEAYRSSVKRKLDAAFGPIPERTPLNARVTGTFEHEGIVVEKVIYESRPGFQVTGAMFRKKGLNGRLPALLYVCGHTPDGFRGEAYQHVILNFADKGFLVFTIDPIGQGERLQYFDQNKGESVIGGPTSEHSFAGLQYLLLGRTMAMVRLWDGIRAVDYLCERPDVDSKRIGVHGRSGEGTMSAYLGAMDERITAAAPECYITSYRRLLESIGPQDAEQILLSQISNGLDHGDFLVARGTLPTLVVTMTRDMFSIQGARETVRSIVSLKPARSVVHLSMVEDDAPHQSTKKNREAVYAFFMKTFGVQGNSVDEDIPPIDSKNLQVTATGQTITSGSKTIHDVIAEDAAAVADNLLLNRKKNEKYFSRIRTAAVKLSGLQLPQAMDEPVFCGRFVRKGYVIEQHILDGEGGLPLPVLLFIPQNGKRNPAIVYLNPAGKDADAGEGGVIERLVQKGYSVLAVDLPGFGELAVDIRGDDSVIRGVSYNIVFGAQLIGRSVTGIQSGHILRACRFLKSRDDIATSAVTCIARGIAGPALLHAAVADTSIGEIVLDKSLLSWLSVVYTSLYDYSIGTTIVPSALTAYDLIDLLCACSPRRLLVYEPVGGDAQPLETEKILEYGKLLDVFYGSKKDRYTLLKAAENTTFDGILLDWLTHENR